MRAVGIDLGTRRVGVAVSDSDGTVATPHAVIERSGDDDADWAAIGALARELGATKLVVGLPLSLDGSRGPAATRAAAEADALGAQTGIPIELHDERLTTVAARAAESGRPARAAESGRPARAAGSARRAARGPRTRDRKGKRPVVDDVAATLILQSWLDLGGVRT